MDAARNLQALTDDSPLVATSRPPLPHLDLSLNSALTRAATLWPDRTFLKIAGQDVSFVEFERSIGRLAGGLERMGLRRGDRLCVFMNNSLACVETWFAANRLGAVWAPINTDFRGDALRRVIELADPQLLICDADLHAVFVEHIATGRDVPLLINGAAPDVPAAMQLSQCVTDDPIAASDVRFSEPSALLFTSGTTGRSKAALLSHRYFISQAGIAIRDFGLREDDVLYCPFPLFHADATALTTIPALLLGCSAAIGRRFSASRFWADVRATGATVFDFMGATLTILQKADPLPDDAANPVRLAWGVPVPEWAPDFERRFGLKILECYGSVETSIPVTVRHDRPRVPGSCGRVIPEFDLIIADDDDEEVRRGSVGEILTRSKIPFTTFTAYYGMTDETFAAGRNWWFHTGDLGRMDEDGNVSFVGRKKEAIRRRGENISAFEVEEGILRHPDVIECAVIGVPSELTEEDVKACVVIRPGSDLTKQEILTHCRDVLGRFQVPRYIEIMEALPKTPTGKLEKYRLKEDGVNARTWDREAVPSAAHPSR
jgi:crotonobetaine/carnitine-CoA ligase